MASSHSDVSYIAALSAIDKTGESNLTTYQAAEFYRILGRSRILDRQVLSPPIIELIGRLLLRGQADATQQSLYLDDFPGLWRRVGVDVDAAGLANLEDRVARRQGKEQIFGTLPPTKDDELNDSKTRRYAAARDMLGVPESAMPRSDPYRLAMITPAYPTLPAVREELLRLGEMDQAARREPVGMGAEQDKELMKRMSEIDAYTLPRIRAIFDRYGMPSSRQVGRAASHSAFLLIQHAVDDPALMRGSVAGVLSLYKKGQLPAIDYALLADRVDCVLDKRPQQFGTQGTRNRKSHWYCPIASPATVNARRATLNMLPLSDAVIYGVNDGG